VIGGIQELASSAKAANGNIIGTRQTPIYPSDYPPPPSLATDQVAWKYTLELPYCKRRVPFPGMHTHWQSAATRNAFSPWITPSEGFCTFINAVLGHQWVVIGKAKEGSKSLLGSTSHRLPDFNPFGVNNDLWNIDAVLLQPGSQL
jgi:hypothetical protein